MTLITYAAKVQSSSQQTMVMSGMLQFRRGVRAGVCILAVCLAPFGVRAQGEASSAAPVVRAGFGDQASEPGHASNNWCPRSATPITVGTNGRVGSGASFSGKLKSAALGAVGGLLGVGGGGGGSSKPSTVRCKIKSKEMTVFSDPLTGIELQVGARRTGDKVEIFSRVKDSPDRGTFQTTYVEREGGDFRTPVELGMCDIYGEFKLTVSWTKDTYVNGQHVDHQEGGWSELGNFKIPGMASSDEAPDGYWRMLGFSNASAGARQIKTTYAIPEGAEAGAPFAFTVHVTRPGEDPVTTVPFTLMVEETGDGFVFSEAPQHCAAPAQIAENEVSSPIDPTRAGAVVAAGPAPGVGAAVAGGANAQMVGAGPIAKQAAPIDAGGNYPKFHHTKPVSSILKEVGGTRFGGARQPGRERETAAPQKPVSSILNEVGGTKFGGERDEDAPSKKPLTLVSEDMSGRGSVEAARQAGANRAALNAKNDIPHDDELIVRTFGEEDVSEFPTSNWEIAAAAALDDMMTFGSADIDRIISSAEYIKDLHNDPGEAEAAEEFRQQQAAYFIEMLARKNELITATAFQELWSERRKVLKELEDYTRIAEIDGVWTLEEKAIHDGIADRLTALMQYTPEEEAELAKQTQIRDAAVQQILGMAEWLGQVSQEDYEFIENAALVTKEIIDWQNFVLPKLGPINLGEINITFTGETANWVQGEITVARKDLLRAETVKLAAQLYLDDPNASADLKDVARDIYLSADLLGAMKEQELAYNYFVITSGFVADMIMFGAAKPANVAAEKAGAAIHYAGRRGKEWLLDLLGQTNPDIHFKEFIELANRAAEAGKRLGIRQESLDRIVKAVADPTPYAESLKKQGYLMDVGDILSVESIITKALEAGVPQGVIDDILARAQRQGTVEAFTEIAKNELAMQVVRAKGGRIITDGGEIARDAVSAFDDFFGSELAALNPVTPMNTTAVKNLVRRARAAGEEFVVPQSPEEFRAVMDLVQLSDQGARNIYYFDHLANALGNLVDEKFIAGARGYMDAIGRDIQRAFDVVHAPPSASLADEIAAVIQANADNIIHDFEPRSIINGPTTSTVDLTVGGATILTDTAGRPLAGGASTIITDAAGVTLPPGSATIITDVAGNPIAHAGGPGALVSNGASTIITDAAGKPFVRLGEGAGAAAADGAATILTDAAGNPLNAGSSTIIEDFGKTWIDNPGALDETMIFDLEMPYVAENFYRSFGNFGPRKSQGYLVSPDKTLTFAERMSQTGERLLIEVGSKLHTGSEKTDTANSVYRCPFPLDSESSSLNGTSLIKMSFKDDAPGAVRECIEKAADVRKWERDQTREIQIQGTSYASSAGLTGLLPQPAFDVIGAQGFDRQSIGGAETIVAVIDSGLDWRHPDFDTAKNLWYNVDEIPGNDIDDDRNGYVDDVIGWNFVSDTRLPWDRLGHGTFISGVIAARTDGAGVEGINPRARIMPLKAVDDAGVTYASLVVEAINYAVKNGAHIINLSVGGATPSAIEEEAIKFARARGVVVVVAAGNEGAQTDRYGPANVSDAIVVAASDIGEAKATRSNFGSTIDLAAPGVGIAGLRARNGSMGNLAEELFTGRADSDAIYYNASGSSFSAAIVSASASLLKSMNPDLTADQIERMLVNSAQDIDDVGIDALSGYGMLDISAALSADPNVFIMPTIARVSAQADNNERLEVFGDADADAFDSAELFLGEGARPEDWKRIEKIKSPVRGGLLAELKRPKDLDSGEWMLRLVVTHENGSQREIRQPLTIQ